MDETVDTVSWLLAEMIKIQKRLKALEDTINGKTELR